jgi:hypothetical protein
MREKGCFRDEFIIKREAELKDKGKSQPAIC